MLSVSDKTARKFVFMTCPLLVVRSPYTSYTERGRRLNMIYEVLWRFDDLSIPLSDRLTVCNAVANIANVTAVFYWIPVYPQPYWLFSCFCFSYLKHLCFLGWYNIAGDAGMLYYRFIDRDNNCRRSVAATNLSMRWGRATRMSSICRFSCNSCCRDLMYRL